MINYHEKFGNDITITDVSGKSIAVTLRLSLMYFYYLPNVKIQMLSKRSIIKAAGTFVRGVIRSLPAKNPMLHLHVLIYHQLIRISNLLGTVYSFFLHDILSVEDLKLVL